jgi:hypothetical protein
MSHGVEHHVLNQVDLFRPGGVLPVHVDRSGEILWR